MQIALIKSEIEHPKSEIQNNPIALYHNSPSPLAVE